MSDFSKILWSDEMRVTLGWPDGPVDATVTDAELNFESEASKVMLGYFYGLEFLNIAFAFKLLS